MIIYSTYQSFSSDVLYDPNWISFIIHEQASSGSVCLTDVFLIVSVQRQRSKVQMINQI